MTTLRLRTGDNIVIEVEEDVAIQCEQVKNLVEDGCNCKDGEIPLSNVSGATLAMVIEWCKKHADTTNAATVGLKEWEAKFVDKDQAELYDLIMAANYLNVKNLLDAVCQKVADMIKGKTPDEIRKTFYIKNDFSPEEEEKIRKDNLWAFE